MDAYIQAQIASQWSQFSSWCNNDIFWKLLVLYFAANVFALREQDFDWVVTEQFLIVLVPRSQSISSTTGFTESGHLEVSEQIPKKGGKSQNELVNGCMFYPICWFVELELCDKTTVTVSFVWGKKSKEENKVGRKSFLKHRPTYSTSSLYDK